MPYALGIDLGGTKILAGLIDTASGQVLTTAVQPTRAEHGPGRPGAGRRRPRSGSAPFDP